ncbi:MAG: LytTR family DNA-binding domain-containing protein [Dyadobacter sp.]|uniref:LytR/AlgR family response regulator transcription factor n=1 Tax=Dyadobacter sp. TaxID=1914288 RepID=UPI0032631689
MIKALIVDDEPKARSVLAFYLENKIEEITQIREAESVDQALLMLKTFKADIVFLDVQMPGKNGFDLLRSLDRPQFEVIFTTAYNQYAIQAIRFSALDYLLKPVDPDELRASVNRYLKKQGSEQNGVLYNNLIQNIAHKKANEFRLAIPYQDGVAFLSLNEIIRLQGEGNYTNIFIKGQNAVLSSRTLKYYEEMLDEFGFIRTHKSHLVNPKFVSKLMADHDVLELLDGARVEISRRKKEEVIRQLPVRN